MGCIYPYFTKYGHTVPCGKCPVCLELRGAQWVFRLQEELKRSFCAHFVTFTYAPEYLPKSPNGYSTLVKRDMQLMMKRLRKSYGKGIKYYVVGEYGSTFQRPHYHAIIFNCPDVHLYQKAWFKGHVYIDTVNSNTMGYTCGYLQKGRRVRKHKNEDFVREFSLMSKGWGSPISAPT